MTSSEKLLKKDFKINFCEIKKEINKEKELVSPPITAKSATN